MQSQPQGMRVDIYSVAIVMWELLTGEIPWKGMDIVQIIQQVRAASFPLCGSVAFCQACAL